MPRDTAGLGSSPFARRYWGNRCYFLLLRVLRCFSSPRSPHAVCVMSGSLPTGCPIRISRGRRVFAPRPGFSQLVTSFFASESLGIPHAPFYDSVIRSCLISFPPRHSCREAGLQARTHVSPFFRVPIARNARLLYSFSRSLAPDLPDTASAATRSALGFHHVIVLFLVWRITESNR